MSLPGAMKLLPRDNKSSCEREVTLNPGQFTVLGSCEQALSHAKSKASEYE